MSVTWSNELELTLLECYQAEPVLWNATHQDYKNKQNNHDAWVRISEVMAIPVADLKKKKDSLLSSYRTYRKKVKDSQHSGTGTNEIYKPIWFAYEAIDSFLGEKLTCKKTQNTEEQSVISEDESQEQTSATQEQGDQSQNIQVTKKQVSGPVRKRNQPPELLEAGNTIKDALATLKTTINKNTPQYPPDDDCDLYGKILAKKLRQLSEDEKLQFMYDIDGMFLRRRQSLLRSPVTTYIASPMTSPMTTYIASPSPSPHSVRFDLLNRPQSSATCYSDSQVNYSLPNIHIPDNNDRETGRKIIITNTQVVQPAAEQPNATSQYSIIQEAFNSAHDNEDY